MDLWINFKNLKISKSIITTFKQNKQIENKILKFMTADLQMNPRTKVPQNHSSQFKNIPNLKQTSSWNLDFSSHCHPFHILPLKSLLCMCYSKEIFLETTICLNKINLIIFHLMVTQKNEDFKKPVEWGWS